MIVAVPVIVSTAIVRVFGVLVVFVGMTVLIMFVSLVMRVFVRGAVIMVVSAAIVGMFMLFVRIAVLVFLMSVTAVFTVVIVAALVVMMIVRMFVLVIAVMRVCCACVDAEFHPFNFAAFLAVKVHVKIPEIELGEFPFQSRGFDSEVTERADRHVAADA